MASTLKRLPLYAAGGAISLVAASLIASKVQSEERKRHPNFAINQHRSNLYLMGSNKFKIIDPSSDEIHFATPKAVEYWADKKLKDLCIMEQHAAAIDENGDLYQWGSGYFGANGMLSPEKTLKGLNLVSLTGNDEFIFALSKEGKVYQIPSKKMINKKTLEFQSSWFGVWIWFRAPERHPHEISINGGGADKIVKISAGKSHLVAVDSKGKLFSGALNDLGNYFGQLGMGNIDSRYTSPIPEVIVPDPHTGEYPEDPRARIVDGSLEDSRHPSESIELTELYEIDKSLFRGEKIVDVQSGFYHSLALSESGRVYGFGSNEMLQLGLGEFDKTKTVVGKPTEIAVPDNLKVTSIAAAGDSSYLVCNAEETSEIFSFGAGNLGQLGIGKWQHMCGMPSRIKSLSNSFYFNEKLNRLSPIRCKYVAAGPWHCAAVMSTTYDMKNAQSFGDNVYSWGYNKYYQLGTGKRNNLNVPGMPLPILIAEDSVELKNQPILKSKEEVEHAVSEISTHDQNFNAGVRMQLYSGVGKDWKQKIYCGHNVTAIFHCK